MSGARPKGFTLIELLVSLAILATLALIVVPVAELQVQHRQEQELRLALREVREAIDAFKRAGDEGRVAREATRSGYPESLQQLVDGVPDLKSPDQQAKLYFLRRIPRDPFFADASVADAQTWGLRSYASEADDPQAGDDVYDIYSLSDRIGLNGVPYKRW